MATLESLDQRLTVLEERSNLQIALERHTSALFDDLAQTITGLAKSQQDGFTNVHRRIETLGERIDTLGERIDTLGERIDTLGER
ncbi:MAG: hypothetical protein OXG53_04255, partial [Chloroflexi bacterium]|nr:hypothetical protein [Chloroflexota bacterium]